MESGSTASAARAARAAALFLAACLLARTAAAADASPPQQMSDTLRRIFGVELLPADALTREIGREQRLADGWAAQEARLKFESVNRLAARGDVLNATLLRDEVLPPYGDALFPADAARQVRLRWLLHRYIDHQAHQGKVRAHVEDIKPAEAYRAAQKMTDRHKRCELLRHVMAQHLYRAEGLAAAMDLFNIEAAAGNYAGALELWATVLQVRRTVAVRRAELLLGLALCWHELGRPQKAKAVLDAAVKRYGRAGVTVAGRRRRLSDVAAELGPRLSVPITPRPLAAWPMFGGAPGRSALPARTLDSPVVSWRAPTPGVSALVRGGLGFKLRGRHWAPAAYPLTVSGAVYSRAEATLEARDWATGRLMWTYAHGGAQLGPTRFGRRRARDCWPMAVGRGVAVWAPRTFVQSRYVPTELVGMAALPRQTRPKVLWTRGGKADTDALLARAAFEHGLLVSGGRVYVLVIEQKAPRRFILCCLILRNGALAWSTPIPMPGTAERRRAALAATGAALVADRSTVYCAVGDGSVCGVDAVSGRLRWAYDCAPGKHPPGHRPASSDAEPLRDPPLLSRGVLLVPVTRGGRTTVTALDSLGVKKLWARPFDQYAGIAGADGDRLYLCALDSRRIVCVNLFDGTEQWRATLAEAPLRPPLVLRGALWCPAASGLWALDGATGAARSKHPLFTWKAVGLRSPQSPFAQVNLVPSAAKFIVAGPDQLVALYSRSFEQEARAGLAGVPDDAATRLDLGHLKRARGDANGAVAEHRAALALALAPNSAVPRYIATAARHQVSTIFERRADAALAGKKIPQAEALLRQALAVHVDKTERARLVSRLAQLLAGAGRAPHAARELTTLVTKLGDAFVRTEPGLRSRARLDAARQRLALEKALPLQPDLKKKLVRITGVLARPKPGRLELAWTLSPPDLAPPNTPDVLITCPNAQFIINRGGRVERRHAYSGRTVWAAPTPVLGARALPARGGGLTVDVVHPRINLRGPAIRRGDVVDKLAGHAVSTPRDVALLCARAGVGRPLPVGVRRLEGPLWADLLLYGLGRSVVLRERSFQTAVHLSDLGELFPQWARPQPVYAVNGGRQVFGHLYAGVFRLLDANGGQLKAAFPVGRPQEHIVAVAATGNRAAALVIDEARKYLLIAYDLNTGREVGRSPVTTAQPPVHLAVRGQQLLLSGPGMLGSSDFASLGARRPVRVLQLTRQPTIIGRPVFFSSGRILLARASGDLESWDVKGLRRRWVARRAGQLLAASDTTVVTRAHRRIAALDPKDGKPIWTKDYPLPPTRAALGPSHLFLYGAHKPDILEAVDRRTGKDAWQRELKQVVWLKHVGSLLVAASQAPGRLHWLHSSTGHSLSQALCEDVPPLDVVGLGPAYGVLTRRAMYGYLPTTD